MRTLDYVTSGTCSRLIRLTLTDDDVIADVQFLGGCNGNLQGIAALVKGQKAADVAQRLRGLQCGYKPTSCPDQLSKALEEAIATPTK